jgi:hypothetical protein
MTRQELQRQIYSAEQARAALGVTSCCMHNFRKNKTLIPLISTRNCNVYARADIEALLAKRGGRITAGRPPQSRAATK